MAFAKKYWRTIIPTILLIAGIIVSFWTFIRDNSARIAVQNEEYISELTLQRGVSVDSLIRENLNFISSTAYLYGKSLTSPWADVAVIRDYEENSVFDMLRFIDTSGDNYTSRGVMSNLSDREYFQAGMRGESGVTYVLQSRVTGEKQIGFYAPVYYQDDIIGVMVGFYGEDYIKKLLEYELFGYQGEAWLCDSDGTILGSTVSENDYDNFLTFLAEDGISSAEEIAHLREAVRTYGEVSFDFSENGIDTTAYAVALTEADWVLVRSFPASASAQILRSANGEGIRLIAKLVTLFLIYVILLIVFMVLDRRKMREANRNSNDISTGMMRLFENFVTLDLDTGIFRHIGGTDTSPALGKEASYQELYDYTLSLIPEGPDKTAAAEFLSMDHLKEALADHNRASIRVAAPIGGAECTTYNFIVIEREGTRPKRLLVVSQDVTELYRREQKEQQRLKEARDAAEQASKAKTEFLFNMSHDLRTPMNAIIGYTELAQRKGVTPDEMRGFIGKIDSSSKHLLALINDILEMSRIESGKLVLEPEDLNLQQVMHETEEMFRTQMDGKGISFHVETDHITDPWVSCDRNGLNRVILNLVSNAYKFTEKGGTILVKLEQEGRTDKPEAAGIYRLHVADSGIGMSQEFVQKLFQPFERERTSTVSRIQGTGLGLSITKKIVDLMGGVIEVRTEQGKGTEFIISLKLPVVSHMQSKEQETKGNDIPLDYTKIRLLLVEDNAINREIAAMMLTQSGFMLESAENGQIAVDMVESSAPGYYDAVLMDVQMPVMDGYTATRQIRALADPALSCIPIIAMTANAFREDIQAAMEAGMNAHIAKPLDFNTMMETLTQVLGNSQYQTAPSAAEMSPR